jgi:transposase
MGVDRAPVALRRTTGRPRTTSLRDVFDAILFVATTGCQWRMLPIDFPPVSTVRGSASICVAPLS